MELYRSKSFLFKLFVLATAISCSFILVVSGIGKLLQPLPGLPLLSRGIGSFELIFSAAVLVFHGKKEIWWMTSALFSLWAGYALFWLIQGLPCGCLGKIMELSPGVALAVDGGLIAVSMLMISRTGSLRLLIKMISFCFSFGILFALFVYKNLSH